MAPYLLTPTDESPQVGGLPFTVHFLGTGAGSPSLQRGCTATALSLGGRTYLFDAGEGVQAACMRHPRVKLGDVTKVFITHLHGDHIFGLPGLLLCLQSINKLRHQQQRQSQQSQQQSDKDTTRGPKQRATPSQQQHRVEIYGPVGLYNYIAASISLSCTELKYVHIDVYELTGGSRRWVHPGSLADYREFRHRGLRRHTIAPNKNGTWTLEVPTEIETPDDALRYSSTPRGYSVQAAQVMHIAKLQCFGYVIQEPLSQPRRVDTAKARAVGLQPGESFKLLKSGFPVLNDDGSRLIQPEEVWLDDTVDPPNKARKLAILGDCCAVPRPMAELCHEADVLIHEATFLESQKGQKIDFGGHSTAAMAAQVAKRVQAKVLMLNHISQSHQEHEVRIVEEAESALTDQPTKVQLSYDLLDLSVPRKGFPTEWSK